MASPMGYEDKDGGDANKKILFRFCSECSNLLFPREDKAEHKLLFACRTCTFAEEAASSCVMRHDIASSTGDTAGVTADIGQDPTLPRIQKECPNCHEHECVFFQSQQRTVNTGMALYFVCIHCGEVFQDAKVEKKKA